MISYLSEELPFQFGPESLGQVLLLGYHNRIDDHVDHGNRNNSRMCSETGFSAQFGSSSEVRKWFPRFLKIINLHVPSRVCWIFGIGHIVIKLLSVYNGLLIYGRYEACDPVIEKVVAKPDQIFPYFVMDVGRSVPGLPGLFVAGVFSAALSSMSSCLNTLSGTIYTDFIKPR